MNIIFLPNMKHEIKNKFDIDEVIKQHSCDN